METYMIWLVAYACVIAALILTTSIFIFYRSKQFNKIHDAVKPKEYGFRARLSFIQPDRQDGEEEKMFSQTGMSISIVGSGIKWFWRLLVVLSNVVLLLFCLDEYYWIKFNPGSESGHYDWTQAGEPVLLIYITVHFAMLYLLLFNADMLFMLPAPLATCNYVLIAEDDPDAASEGDSDDGVEDSWLQ